MSVLLYYQWFVEGGMSVINQQFLLDIFQLVEAGLFSFVQITLLSILLRGSLYQSIRQSLLAILHTNFIVYRLQALADRI